MLNNSIKENSIKLKLNILENWGQPFYTIAKPWWMGFIVGIHNFNLKASEILDFESFSSI